VPEGAVVNGAAHTLAPVPLMNLYGIHRLHAVARCGHGTESSTYTCSSFCSLLLLPLLRLEKQPTRPLHGRAAFG
jgi:hypothetical protein